MTDTTFPELVSLTFPATVDVSGGGTAITIDAVATDESGIKQVVLWFDKKFTTNIGTFSLVGLYGYEESWDDGRTIVSRIVSHFNDPGEYSLLRVDVTDNANYTRLYSAEQAQAFGAPPSLTIVGSTADHTAPELKNLTFTEEVDVTTGSAALTIHAEASDDLSGIKDVVVWLNRGMTTDVGTFDFIGVFGIGDSWEDGVSSVTRAVSQLNAPGPYQVARVDVHDLAGNTTSYTPQQLAALGVATELTVADTEGGPDSDSLWGTSGNDVLNGSGGDDTLIGGVGHDTINGGDGRDTVSYANATSGVHVNLAKGVALTGVSALQAAALPPGYIRDSSTGHVYTYVNHELLSWDQARLEAAAQTFAGVSGHLATLTSYQEWQFVQGLFSAGQDTIYIGGSDAEAEGQWRWVTGPEAAADGGSGLLFWSGAADGAIQNNLFAQWLESAFQSGGSFDTSVTDYLVMYSYFSPLFSGTRGDREGISPSGGGASGYLVEFSPETDTLSGIENIIGSIYDDHVIGDHASNIIRGNGGYDTLDGNLGDDIIYGDSGSETLMGGEGNDVLYGDVGDDSLRGGEGQDRIYGGSGSDYIDGAEDHDHLYDWDGGNDILLGGGGNDSLSVRRSQDGSKVTLQGDEGRDDLGAYGVFASASLSGGADNDHIVTDNANGSWENAGGPIGLDGGSGDDIIDVFGYLRNVAASGDQGNDTINAFFIRDSVLDGGEGSDVIYADTTQNVTIRGGAGNDLITSHSISGTIDAGTGSDEVRINYGPSDVSITVSLGDDIDKDTLALRYFVPVEVRDFKAGIGGDILDISRIVDLLRPWGGSEDPWHQQTGILRLIQDGSDTLIQLDSDGPSNGRLWNSTVARLKDVALPDLVDANIQTGGYPLPPDAPQIASGGLTDSSQASVTGTGTPGLMIKLYDAGMFIGDTIVSDDGRWTVDGLNLTNGTHTLTARAEDQYGVLSGLSDPIEITVDTLPPAEPDVSSPAGPVGDATPNLTGTAEAGAVIEIHEGNTLLGTTTAGEDGHWGLTLPTLADGSHTLSITARDAAGNVSDSTSHELTIDTQGPDQPVITPLAASGLVGTSRPILTGTAEAGATVQVFDGNELIGETIADETGAWSVALEDLTDGTHNLKAIAADEAGNPSSASSAVTVTVDTTPPDAPLAVGGVSGSSRPTLTGTAEAEATVRVYDGITLVGETVADKTGAWSVVLTEFTDGPHDLTTTATDKAGNTSQTSSPVTLTVDTTPPAAPSLQRISTDTGASGSDGITSDNTLAVWGAAEALSTVKIYDGATLLGTVKANASGRWALDFAKVVLADGVHQLTATATDAVGNTSVGSLPFQVTIDRTGPTGTAITSALSDAGAAGSIGRGGVTKDTSLILTGKAEAQAAVTVLLSTGETVGTTTADANGLWSLGYTAGGDGKVSFVAIAADLAGNTHQSKAFAVTIDTTAPDPLITRAVASTTRTVLSGTAEAGATVKILENGVVLDTATAGANGTWKTSVPKLSDVVHTLTLQATDRAGNADTHEGLILVGSTNADVSLTGSTGADVLLGTGGKDRLDGGAGNDRYSGGTGADVFVFSGAFGSDMVTDYQDGRDKLDLDAGLTFASLSLTTLDADTDGVLDDVLISTTTGQTIKLLNTQVGDLSATDFLF
jgi:Ca2+-binding RTX toxin-like protein